MTLLDRPPPLLAGRGTIRRAVTLTPAPAIDRVYFVDSLVDGHVHRAERVRVVLAGKGLNVARDLAAAGGETRAVYPLAAVDRASLGPGAAEDIAIPVPWQARVNAVVAGRDGSTTNINAAAHPLTKSEWQRCAARALSCALEIGADWLVVAGALPRLDTGQALDLVPLVTAAHHRGIAVALDTSGGDLGRTLSALEPIDLAKPNLHELGELTRRPIRTLGDAIDAAQQMRSAGVRAVLVSMGAEGALLVSERHSVWARSPVVRVVNTTGAGDAMLAGYISIAPGRDTSRDESVRALRRAVSWGSLAVQLETAALDSVVDDDRVAIQEVDRNYRLQA